jgi:hypothetical protein
MRRFTKEDGPLIQHRGEIFFKRRNPVYLIPSDGPFEVETNEGVLKGNDFIAYDPLSGHVWPVSKEYVAMHYEKSPTKDQEYVKMGRKVQTIAEILKSRFGNMNVAEALEMSTKIIVAVEKADAQS